MNKFLTVILCTLLLTACGKKEQAQQKSDSSSTSSTGTSTESAADGDESETVYSGKLGNGSLSIVMRLIRKGTNLSGTYLYANIGEDIRIDGEADADNNITINEFDPKGNQTGLFKGKISGDEISGQWSKPDGSSPLSFTLTKASAGTGSMSFTYGKMEDSNKQKRYHVLVTYPIMSGYSNPYTQAKFNGAIYKDALKTFTASKKSQSENSEVLSPEDMQNFPADAMSEEECKSTVTYHESNVVSVVQECYYSQIGAAHPNADMRTINFDLTEGKVLALNDLFKSDAQYLPVLVAESKKDIDEYLKSNSGGDDVPSPELDAKNDTFEEFAFAKSGLHIYFGEIMSHAIGLLEAEVPYSALKDMAKPKSALARVAAAK